MAFPTFTPAEIEAQRQRAVALFQATAGRTITLEAVDADPTPAGKRRAKVVRLNSGHGREVIRWYVGARTYRQLEPTTANAILSAEWANA